MCYLLFDIISCVLRYVFRVQGRIVAIQNMKLQDVASLMADMVLAEEFKTARIFTYQPIEIPDMLKLHLRVYLKAREHVSITSIRRINDMNRSFKKH